MTLLELMKRMGTFLKAERVPYFVFGAVGMDYWAGPRATLDLDLVICIGRGAVPPFAQKLRDMGFPVTKMLERLLQEGRIIKIKMEGADLDLKLCKGDHDQEALRRAKDVEMGGATLSVATPEDIVLFKLQSWRRQDQADIERIKNEVKDLHLKYIDGWLGKVEEATGYPVRERWESLA